MNKTERNNIFNDYIFLADKYVKQYANKIRMCGMSNEDAWQEICVSILAALDGYNPGLGDDVKEYLQGHLNCDIHNILSPEKRYGISETPRHTTMQVEVIGMNQIAASNIDELSATHWLMEEVAALPDNQRAAVYQHIYGDSGQPRNGRDLGKARKNIKKRMDEIGMTVFPERKERFCIA